MPHHRYLQCLLVYVSATSALFARMLCEMSIATPMIAAPLGFMLAIIVARRIDKVSETFKTDVDRILKPNEKTSQMLGLSTIPVLAVVSALAGIVGPEFAAASGVFVAIHVAKNMLGM